MHAPGDRGHAIRAHPADVVIEAWAPSAAACYEEAAAAFAELFVDTRHGPPGSPEPFDVGPGSPEVLLVLLLEEMLFRADARGHVPIAAAVEVRGDHLVGRFTILPVEQARGAGAIPKGVSHSGLEFARTGDHWHSRAIVDV